MTFETQQTYLGKTQAIKIAELRSERLIFVARLAVGAVYSLFLTIALLMQQVTLVTFLVGIGATAVLMGVNAYGLVRLGDAPESSFIVYFRTFVDVTFITSLIWAHNGIELSLVHMAIFCAYFVVITFTALHFRPGLVFFGGALSVLEYSAFFFWFSRTIELLPHGSLTRYLIQVGVLLLVTVLSVVITRNNTSAIHRVVFSEIRYQNLVHRLSEMIFTLDANRAFLWANMASHSILAIPSKAIKRRCIDDFFLAPPLNLGPNGTRGTYEIRDFDNNRKFVDCVIQPVTEAGSAVAFEGIMTDVTERELAISQREAMVSRLYQYQKMESLGTLASGMAHDFNNILQTVSGLCDRVQGETAEVQTRQLMQTMSETLVDARFLVSELLAFGRKTKLDFKNINLHLYLSEVVAFFAQQLGASYTVKLDVGADPLFIQGDASYLKRIFQNFFVNARDAMPQGGGITVSAFSEHNEGAPASVVIRFSDTGTGIPQQLVDKVFDPFITTKQPGKGTGLGLALVQRIVSLHNGTVAIEKTSPQGTTFRISLPEADPQDSGVDTKWMQNNRIKSRLLLLDDDKKIRDILKFFLNDLGYTISEATTSQEAAVQLNRYKDECLVLIMDWKLRDEDPHAVIRALRSIRPELVVLVVSGYPPKTSSIEAMNIYRWFTKPYEKNQLDIEIQRALHKLTVAQGESPQ